MSSTIDSWEEEVIKEEGVVTKVKDVYKGKEAMNEVNEKKYLGDLIAKNGTNHKNIKERTNKAHGNIDKIVSTLNERPYGKHFFKAAKLMREAILINGLLSNSESWINVSKKDLEDLERPDMLLQRKILTTTGNPSKCFIQLELGIIPVKFVIMQKRLNFLHYILHEDIDSMIRQVFVTQRGDSKKGDFKDLTDKDRISLDIEYTDNDIEGITKQSWTKYVKNKIEVAAFNELSNENSTKEKTKSIQFEDMKISKYLELNMRTSLSRLIFSVRSKTIDIKEYQSWKYENDKCVRCHTFTETMNHFVTCSSYLNETCEDWAEI